MITLRRATLDDLPLLCDTRIDVLRTVNGLDDSVDMEHIRSATADHYTRTIPTGDTVVLLALDGDSCVATGAICFFDVMPTYHNPSGRKGYLMNIYTRPDYRRRGIGHSILDALVDEARQRGVHAISLEATDMGRPMYEKYGFVKLNDEMELMI